jgi:hypothetical protein
MSLIALRGGYCRGPPLSLGLAAGCRVRLAALFGLSFVPEMKDSYGKFMAEAERLRRDKGRPPLRSRNRDPPSQVHSHLFARVRRYVTRLWHLGRASVGSPSAVASVCLARRCGVRGPTRRPLPARARSVRRVEMPTTPWVAGLGRRLVGERSMVPRPLAGTRRGRPASTRSARLPRGARKGGPCPFETRRGDRGCFGSHSRRPLARSS